MTDRPIITRKRIAAFIGENVNSIKRLVDEEGLPAWKGTGRRTPWKAFPEDLIAWLKCQQEKCCQANFKAR